MLAPVDDAHTVVERFRSRRRKRGHLEQHTIRDARPQAGAIRLLERCSASDAAALDFDVVDDATGRELLGREIRRAGRRRDVETMHA
jgi:hypothetical protein